MNYVKRLVDKRAAELKSEIDKLATTAKAEIDKRAAIAKKEIDKRVAQTQPDFRRTDFFTPDLKTLESVAFDLSDIETSLLAVSINLLDLVPTDMPELSIEVPELSIEVPELSIEVPELSIEVPDFEFLPSE